MRHIGLSFYFELDFDSETGQRTGRGAVVPGAVRWQFAWADSSCEKAEDAIADIEDVVAVEVEFAVVVNVVARKMDDSSEYDSFDDSSDYESSNYESCYRFDS